jgi:cytochrome c oxidase accessory protein FixG
VEAGIATNLKQHAELPTTGGLSTLNADGSRRWLRPRPSRGKYWRRRRFVAYFLIALFTAIPYIRVGGKPLILLDIVHRQFTFFGKTFLPTDTVLLALLLVGIFIAVFLATAVLGRVWCGWACPQTVYMEFVFRPVERLFEGEPGKRKPLIKDPAAAKVVKFIVYLLVSMFLAHTFLAYFVGVEQLIQWVQRSPLEHPTSFLVMALVTAMMLFDFGFFREQMCIVACPYGRFQSVMLDRQSLVISYDNKRGEPRGKLVKSPSLSLTQLDPRGDCVDCRMCVTTCPTGIDIRNGLQMECIACAQCVDACDAVMTRIGRPTGLIRYSTQARMDGDQPRRFRPRLFLYPAILTAVVALFATLLITKSPADVAILRGPGMPFNTVSDSHISNQVKLHLTNRTGQDAQYTLELINAPGAQLRIDTNPIPVPAGKRHSDIALIVAPRDILDSGARNIFVRVSDGRGFTKDAKYRLLGPVNPAPTPRNQP